MKKFFILMLAVAASAFTASYAGTRITQEQLPKEARDFISKYFSGALVKKVEKDQGHRGMEYEVEFSNGAEIDFREDGTWKDVKAAKGNAVPAAIVPAAIAKHVKDNHADLPVTEISRKRGGYEIELSNGTELKLTEDAKPLTNQNKGHRGNRPRK